MIDNFDSFTFNLVQYFKELDQDVQVFRNDALSIADIEQMSPDHIVISPGPGRPENAGISLDVIQHFYTQIPLLGVCLGHQALAQLFGATIVRAKALVHGKTSPMYHEQRVLFEGVPSPFQATRYHSLVVDEATLPSCFEVTAWTENDVKEKEEIMGIKHKDYPVFGVQFHPEAILTEYGHKLLDNFISYSHLSTVNKK